PGSNSIDQMCARFDLPADLAGKRVLDIGGWNGCHSFECERRGAREVIALGPEQPDKTGFNRLREAIGSTRVKYVLGSVYDLDPQKLGFFDVVLFCGVLYHLRYPLLGIDNIRRVCSGDVFIETYVQPPRRARSKWVYRFARLLGLGEVAIPSSTIPVHERPPCWDFFRHNELQADYSNWFGPNISAVLQAFESAGFATRLVWDTVVRDSFGRATFHGKVKAGVPEFLRIPCGESVF